MAQKYFCISIVFVLIPTCAFVMSRYSTHMQEAPALPSEIKGVVEQHAPLQCFIESQFSAIADQVQTITSLQSRVDFLQAEHDKLAKLLAAQIAGPRKETHISSALQGWLPFESQEEFEQAKAVAEAEAQAIVDACEQAPPKRKKTRKESLTQHLPVIDRVFDVSEDKRVCPTHGAMNCIGCDETETLVLEPPKLYCFKNKFMKYACSCCSEHGIVSSERPTGLVEGNKYDPSIAATIVTDKYDRHLPVNRQVDSFASSGWTPSRSTLLNILVQVCFVVEPFVSHMAKLVKSDNAIGLDETGCRMLMPQEDPFVKPGDLKAKRLLDKIAEAKRKMQGSIHGKMWAYSGLNKAQYNIFDFRISRHRDGPQEFLVESKGYVQGDCFSGNLSVVLQSEGRLTFAACWAHARRYLVESSDYKAECEKLLDLIHALYDIEQRAVNYSIEERHALRERESIVVLNAMRKQLDLYDQSQILPRSDFAGVVGYIHGNWAALTSYASTGFVPIDNNAIERLMKQVALGRKNWLFVGNVAAGERSAMLMSLVSSAKRHDLDVWKYVKDVLDQLLAGETNYTKLLPDVWKQSHPEAVREHRVEERRDKAERKQYDRAKRLLEAKAKRNARD
jgi:transposase